MHFKNLGNKTKSVLSIKESYSLKKKSQKFTNAYGQAGGFPFSFFTPCLRRFCVSLNFTWSN